MFYKLPILKIYASRLLKEKLISLENDVKKCLSESKDKSLQTAPFTALLACFSTLDFLAALNSGNTETTASTTKQVEDFIEEYFNYSKKKEELLLKIYRHKLVHLFQPGHLVEYRNKSYSWKIYNKNKRMHLVISKVNKLINPAPSVRLMIHCVFSISIITFKDEIITAADRYFVSLTKDYELQKKFDKAINGIFSIYPKV